MFFSFKRKKFIYKINWWEERLDPLTMVNISLAHNDTVAYRTWCLALYPVIYNDLSQQFPKWSRWTPPSTTFLVVLTSFMNMLQTKQQRVHGNQWTFKVVYEKKGLGRFRFSGLSQYPVIRYFRVHGSVQSTKCINTTT